MMQMELPQLLNEYLPRPWKQEGLDWVWVIVIWLSYILSEGEHRKVVVHAWVNQRRQLLEQVCGIEIRDTDFSDDRLSIVLKHLSADSTWASIEQSVNGRTMRLYELPQETARLDGTTVSGNHLVNEEGLFQFGYSKDEPSLAQVKVMMATLDPLGMPLATQVVSGEKADDRLYIPAFEQARVNLPSEVLWVGDCKMGSLATRAHIHHHHHYYLMPLARTGKVPELLEQSLVEMTSQKQSFEKVTLLKADGSINRELEGYVSSRCVEGDPPEGYPVCWQEQVFLVYSANHSKQQQQGLQKRLDNATQKLLALTPPVGRGRKQIRDEPDLVRQAQAILKYHNVEGFLEYTFSFEEQTKTRKARYQITNVTQKNAAIEQQQRSFGWRVYVSNAPVERLSFEQAVLTYRDEWIVEHGFHRLKGKSLGASPMFVRRDDQVKGLMHLLSLGLMLLSLIEFVVRRQLSNTQDSLSGLYPGNPKKTTTRPTTERLLKAFDNITLTWVEVEGKSYSHVSALTPLQEKIIQLLGFSPRIYTDLLGRPG